MLLGVRGGRTGEERFGGAVSSELSPNATCSLCELILNGLGVRFRGSWRRLSGEAATTPLLLLFPPLSPSPLHTLLSREADLLSSDLNLDNEKSPLERGPMLMLRTTLDFLEGLCRTCFNTAVFLPQLGGVTSLSAGWLKVKDDLLSSTGKSVIETPFMW